jgi:hypothetical protein
MAKFIYVGDPLGVNKKTGRADPGTHGGEISYDLGAGNKLKFTDGKPTEVPAELVERFSRNNHFRLVDEVAATGESTNASAQGDADKPLKGPRKK